MNAALIIADHADAIIQRIMVERWWAQLAPREREVLEARQAGALLREISKELGIGKERVRQIEFRAFRHLRGAMHRDHVDTYFEATH
jgi:RNA polymerase sigma factor (sigma-70 family)